MYVRRAFLAIPSFSSIHGRAYSTDVESSQTRLAGRNSVVTELHVGNVSRASSTVTVASQRGRVKGTEEGPFSVVDRAEAEGGFSLKSLGYARNNVVEKAKGGGRDGSETRCACNGPPQFHPANAPKLHRESCLLARSIRQNTRKQKR